MKSRGPARKADPAFPIPEAMAILSGGKRVIMPRGLNGVEVGQLKTVINRCKTPDVLKRVFDWLEAGAEGYRERIDLSALCKNIGTWIPASEQEPAGPVKDPRYGICESAA